MGKNPKKTERNGTKQFKPHEVEAKRLYAFTINPNDNNQFWEKDREDRYQLFRDGSLKRLKDALDTSNFTLHLDISSAGRMHWHGYISWDNLEDYYDFQIKSIYRLKKWSNIEIDYINDKQIWREYVIKYHRIKKLIIKNGSNFTPETICMLYKYFGKNRGKTANKKYDKDIIDIL